MSDEIINTLADMQMQLRAMRADMARIESGQANIKHEIDQMRADLAIITSRQNSAIASTKKKQTRLPITSNGWLFGSGD